MPDHTDRPETDGYDLVMPFIVCQTNGGPYDDDAFVAGFQAGEIDQALKTASTVRAAKVHFAMVHTALLPQLELIAMHRGFPKVLAEQTEGYEEWADVTFAAATTGEETPDAR
jgi:hypothetical protein